MKSTKKLVAPKKMKKFETKYTYGERIKGTNKIRRFRKAKSN